jgi:hypothetical protein
MDIVNHGSKPRIFSTPHTTHDEAKSRGLTVVLLASISVIQCGQAYHRTSNSVVVTLPTTYVLAIS